MNRQEIKDRRRETGDRRQKSIALSSFVFRLSSFVLIVFCPLLFLTTCKSSKETTSSSHIALQAATQEERVKALLDYAIQYNTLSAPVSFKITIDGKSNSLEGQLRIVKGECIQLSLKMPLLGSELFRMQITTARIIMIDRYNKQYMDEPIANLTKGHSIDFNYHDLEALFTNRLFLAGNQDIAQHHSKFMLADNQYNAFLNYTDKQFIDYIFRSDYTNRILETNITDGEERVTLRWLYSDFRQASNRQLFPMKEEIIAKADDKEVSLSLTYKSVDIDTDFNIDYKLPAKYVRIGFDDFMEMIKLQLQ